MDAGEEVDAGSDHDAGTAPSCDVDHGGCAEDEVCQIMSGQVKCEPCGPGSKVDDNACVALDPCTLMPCGEHGHCTVTGGGYDCSCDDGYESKEGTCADVDECEAQTFTCDPFATCMNTEGSYDCVCPAGYSLDNGQCVDTNECAQNMSLCPTGSTCQNAIGSSLCVCPAGQVFGGGACLPGTLPQYKGLPVWEPIDLSESTGAPLELGMKFRSEMDGVVIALRYYRSPSSTATDFEGRLWDGVTQRLLATVSFPPPNLWGWQTATLPTPVALIANRTYVVSYGSSDLYFTRTLNAFTSSESSDGPLHALQSGVDGDNGVFSTTVGTFPTSSYADSNYFADVVLQPREVCPATGSGCDANATCLRLGMNQYQCTCQTNYVGDGHSCTFDPPEYTAIPDEEVNRAPVSLLDQELGMKFRVTEPAHALGVRYYRSPGAHGNDFSGRLWDAATQQVIAEVYFDSTTFGWVKAYFTKAIPLQVNKTYVVSYSTSSGPNDFLRIPDGFRLPFTNGPVRALANGEDGGNGVVGDKLTYPSQTPDGSNYFIDIIVKPDGP